MRCWLVSICKRLTFFLQTVREAGGLCGVGGWVRWSLDALDDVYAGIGLDKA